MFTTFVLHIAFIAQTLNISFGDALEQEVYVVPTTVEQLRAEQEDAITKPQTARIELRVYPEAYLHSADFAPRNIDRDAGPEIDASSALVLDERSGRILWQKNPDHVQSIASITKLMTALVWLDHQPRTGFDHVHTFSPDDDTSFGKELDLPLGDQLTVADIWKATLIESYNDTARALMHTAAISEAEFIEQMNTKAHMINAQDMHFVEPTGLAARNAATVHDVALLAHHAFQEPQIRDTTVLKHYAIESLQNEVNATLRNTNLLLHDASLILEGGKTGYIEEAGYCVVVRVRIPDTSRALIVVVLGASSDEVRFTEAKKIIEWTLAHYVFPTDSP